jgi:hypothetical protein
MVNLLFAVSIGCLLGTRYSFLILILASGAAGAVYGALSLVHPGDGNSGWTALLLVASGLQGGYMIGLTLRDYGGFFVSRRSRRA